MKKSNKGWVLKSPLRYPGGKSRASEHLCSLMPVGFKEYREPFVGGGSVFLSAWCKYRKVCKNWWINDAYYDLYCFYKGMCSENLVYMTSLIRTWKNEYSGRGRELYDYLRGNIHSFDDLTRGAAFFVLNRITFSDTTLSGGYSQSAFEKRFTTSSIDRVIDASWPMHKGTKVTGIDYEDVIKESGDDVFIFLDPPYYTAERSALYGRNGDMHRGFDHERLRESLEGCGHKWMMTYDDCSYISELYKGYNVHPLEFSYGMRNIGQDSNMRGKELIITNY